MLGKIILLVFAFLVLVVPVNAEIINGDFETGDFTGWSQSGDGVSYFLHIPHTGSYGLQLRKSQLHHTTGSASLTQYNIDTTNYDTLSFYGSQTNVNGPDAHWERVSIGGINCYVTATSWTHYEIDISSLSGMQTLTLTVYCDGGNSGWYYAYLHADDFALTDYTGPAIGQLYIADNPANQNWYINQSKYPNLDIYFEEIIDYQINEHFNVSKDYYINCTTSNDSHPYTYNYFIDDNNGNSYDNSIYSRMGMKTKILYPDSPTTYTFHLYEIEEKIKDSFPWYYWLIYPLYMLVEMFADDPDLIITEIDTIDITLSKISGNNETIPDIPEEPKDPEIPDPEPDPDEPINWTIPEEPPIYNTSNQSINISWVEGYYSTINNTIENLCSPMYNFTNWSLSPIINLNSDISVFNNYMNASFTQITEDSSILYESINTIFNAIPPKIRNVITYYLIWVVLLIIFKKK